MDFSKMVKYLNPPKYKIESKGIKLVRDRTGNISDCLSKKWDIATFGQKLINEILKKDYQPYQLTVKEELIVEQLPKINLEVGIGPLERILLLRWLKRKNFQQVSWKFH